MQLRVRNHSGSGGTTARSEWTYHGLTGSSTTRSYAELGEFQGISLLKLYRKAGIRVVLIVTVQRLYHGFGLLQLQSFSSVVLFAHGVLSLALNAFTPTSFRAQFKWHLLVPAKEKQPLFQAHLLPGLLLTCVCQANPFLHHSCPESGASSFSFSQ